MVRSRLAANGSMNASDEHVAVPAGVPMWLRRSMTIPLYFVLWGIAVAAAPVLFALAALVDVARARPWPTVRCLAFFLLYLTCELSGIVASFALWLVRGPWTRTPRDSYLNANFVLQCWWARSIFRGAERIFAMTSKVEGDDLVEHGPFLLFLRHASVGDTVLPANFISDRHAVVLRYVLKRELLWDPCLDIVGNRLPNYFIWRDSPDSAAEVEGVKKLAEDLGPKDGVLIYPEGTRFTPAKQARILDKLARSADTHLAERASTLRHVLPPRFGGALGLLEASPEADVVFCAHVGFEDAGNFARLLGGSLVNQVIRLRFWRVAYDEIPADTAERKEWLLDWWARMDAWIDAQKKTP